jgi:hypothetical protein
MPRSSTTSSSSLLVLLLASSALAREPELIPRATPWPAALPCEKFVRAELYVSHDAELTWSGPKASRRFTLRRVEGSHEPVLQPLDETFPVAALDKVELRAPGVGPRDLSLGIHLECRADAQEGVWWGQGASDGLSVVYPREKPPDDLLPPILAQNAGQVVSDELMRFAGEVVGRTSAALDEACPGERCAKPVRAAADRLRKLRGAAWKSPRVKSSSEELFHGLLQHRGWTAELSAGDTKLTLACGSDVTPKAARPLKPGCRVRIASFLDDDAQIQCDRFPVTPATRCLWSHAFHFPDGVVELTGDPKEKDQQVNITGAAVELRR